MILNCLEVAFWGAVAFLTLQANIKQCDGTSCTLGWIVVVLAVILKYVHTHRSRRLSTGLTPSCSILANYTAIVSVLDWKHFRNYRMPRGTKISSQRSDQESLATLQIPRQ